MNRINIRNIMKGLRYWVLSVSLFYPFTFLPLFAAHVETDRHWYLAGEAMKVSVTDDDALIAYVELCDMHGLAAGVVVGLKGGQGTGIIELPPHLHSGYYVLSVYTRHHANVSQQLVAVINPLHKSGDDDIEWVKLADSESESFATTDVSPNAFLLPPSTIPVDERETEGHIIRARVSNVYGGKTYEGSQILPSLSIIGQQIHYFEGKMVGDSLAVFYTYGIHGKLPLVLSAVTSTGESLPIEMISPFATLLPKQLPHLVFHYRRSEVEARSLDMQRHQIAITPAKREIKLGDRSDDSAEEGRPLPYDETIHGITPYLSYNLDEYRQFLTIREVLLEYVQCVSKRKINGRQQLIVQTELDQYNNITPSLVLIDGMPVLDTKQLLNYDARRVHYINIYGDQFTFGRGVYSGLLSFITRSGRLTNYPTDPNAQYLVYSFP